MTYLENGPTIESAQNGDVISKGLGGNIPKPIYYSVALQKGIDDININNTKEKVEIVADTKISLEECSADISDEVFQKLIIEKFDGINSVSELREIGEGMCKKTREAIQELVGVNPDGDFGPLTLKGIKNYINIIGGERVENIGMSDQITSIAESILPTIGMQKHGIKSIENYMNLPKSTKNQYRELAQIFNLDYSLVCGVAMAESCFDTKARSSSGAEGTFQLMGHMEKNTKKHLLSTAKYQGGEERFMSDMHNNSDFMRIYKQNPLDSLAIMLLASSIHAQKSNISKGLGYYNGGGNGVISAKITEETKRYKKIVPVYAKFAGELLDNNIIT